ncbi:hypothetical protein QPK13_02370 [Photorhabdus tasmaniensis]
MAIGDVLYLHCPFTTPPKLKYLLVCCCEPLLVLIINSKISEFIQLRQELLRCQIDLPQKDHKFLQWDSFINCIDAHAAFDINDIKGRISTDYHNIVKGKVADYCMREVYKAVKCSPDDETWTETQDIRVTRTICWLAVSYPFKRTAYQSAY